MASRALVVVAAALLVAVLLLLLLPAGAHADIAAGRRTTSFSVRRQLPQKNEAGRINEVLVRSYGISRLPRKLLGEKSTPLEDAVQVVDVGSYGAVGDGKQDHTEAFQKAWAAACSSSKPAILLVPKEKTYLVKQITFSGKCKSSVTFRLEGKLVAPERSSWPKENTRKWIVFNNIDSLTITGGGTIDGNGETWWKNSCRVDKNMKCTVAPMALLLSKCNELKVENIKLLNSQQIHMSVEDCKDVLLKRITIIAPGDSPENDGIHIARTKDIQVIDCNIKTGDDCLSVETGTENLYTSRITCGPGHGISVGSLDDNNSEARVSNVTIYKAKLSVVV